MARDVQMSRSNYSRSRVPLETSVDSSSDDDDDYHDDSPDNTSLLVARNPPYNATRANAMVRNSILPKSLFLGCVIAFILWFYRDEKSNQVSRNSGSNIGFCMDPDDPTEWKNSVMTSKSSCQCLDPTRPAPRYNDKMWDKHHQVMLNDIDYVISNKQHQELDFVMLGDSITERWNGTRGIGRVNAPEFRAIYDKYFHRTEQNPDAPLYGLALGASGDISPELLWHIQNGILTNEELTPKVWVVLIGTNDIGRSNCSKHTTLSGILQVLNYIHTYRPNVPIIVHGLLPRSDNFGKGDYSLGRMYTMIAWINKELEKVCNLHPNWHYLNVNELFLLPSDDKDDIETEENNLTQLINRTRMEDALHPSVIGCDLWGPLLVKEIQKWIR